MKEQKKRVRKRVYRKKKQSKLSAGRFFSVTGAVMLAIALCVSGTFLVFRAVGKSQLKKGSVGSVAEMTMGKADGDNSAGKDSAGEGRQKAEQAEDSLLGEKEGRVFYQGKAYDFNQDILTFLIMGIDQRTEKVTEYTEGFNAGSADAIFLLVLNPHTEKMQILAIDRNTMTDVDIYDYYGKYEETVQTQICVQHGFGDGTKKSAGYMEKAVSNLLYGLPINGYCAVNMSAVSRINDSIGGVEVEVLDDCTAMDKSLVKGDTVHLKGSTAFWYVKYRDTNVFGSAEGRLERQKQYINAFIKKAKQEFKGNPSLPVTLFHDLREYMTTDLTVEKVTYLASMAVGFDYKNTSIRKIPGETVMGEEYEEFYVDEDALYQMMLDVFYEEVK